MKILAVDDDRLQLDLLSAILKDAGFSDLTTVTSGALALHEIINAYSPFDCILLDIQMPELDGVELCKIIRMMPNCRTTPIVMITAMSDRSYVDGAFHAGATDYVTKPFDNMELLTRIKIAARLSESGRIIADKIFAVKSLRDKIEAEHHFEYHDAVMITDVPGVVDSLILDNYLLQLSRTDTMNSTVVAFKIAEFRELYQRFNKGDLHEVLCDIAESIAGGLTGSSFLLAYKGSGNFVCVLDRTPRETLSELCAAMQSSIDEMGLEFPDSHKCKVTLVMGDPQGHAFLSLTGQMERIDAAIDSVERKASGAGDLAAASNWWRSLRKAAGAVGARTKELS